MAQTWAVVPMFNEGSVIASVVTELRKSIPHVVCIDDCSTDNSVAQAESAGAIVVRHPINLGQGASLQTGFEFVRTIPEMTEIVTFDADGQHQVADALDMVQKLRDEHLDIVIGSRFLDDRTDMSRLKRAVLRLATGYTRMTTGMALTDAHNGLRVISRDLLMKMQLKQNRMAHASELIDQVRFHHATWAEHPTHIVYTDYSRSKGQSVLNSVNILVEIIFK
ncbi:glycosyltransferase family 2 protein [Salinibacterium sp. M195]|uniref:glycosyltransferase family 2 protein n=1 Tax=Salinibacterium sp. M195 TaxID=2583374 RepID=UPI001C62C760|nr:glycosyltransferase family 2 protein [Salinibacterium sp. M195]